MWKVLVARSKFKSKEVYHYFELLHDINDVSPTPEILSNQFWMNKRMTIPTVPIIPHHRQRWNLSVLLNSEKSLYKYSLVTLVPMPLG